MGLRQMLNIPERPNDHMRNSYGNKYGRYIERVAKLTEFSKINIDKNISKK